MGWPVSHSKSPALHGYWLKELGIDGTYIALPVEPENLGAALRALPAKGFAGVNLTVPHKEAALAHLDEVDAVARKIGAVNTVIVGAAGQLKGTNTDAYGFMENLRAEAPDLDVTKGPAVVLGAGGSARAVCYGLLSAGCPEIRLVNRSHGRAKVFAEVFGEKIVPMPWSKNLFRLDAANLLVNTTILGMPGQQPVDVDLGELPDNAVVADIVYTPPKPFTAPVTELLSRAQMRGLATVDGLGMLLYQAQLGFEAWWGVKPEVTEALRAHVLGQT
jgi:shikimate dehydrogenase